MKVPWQRKDNADLERALVSARAVPREELVARLLEQIGNTAPERVVPVRRGRRRLALAGVVTASMLVLLAAFGGVGYAKSSCSKAAHSVYEVVALHHKDPGKPRDTYSSANSAALYREHPNPGYFCGTKGSKHKIKLVVTQARYDRLVARGWTLGPGPFWTKQAAREICPLPRWGNEDYDD
jgi:hypothetical protein